MKVTIADHVELLLAERGPATVSTLRFLLAEHHPFEFSVAGLRTTLYRLVKEGRLERVKYGLYKIPGTMVPERATLRGWLTAYLRWHYPNLLSPKPFGTLYWRDHGLHVPPSDLNAALRGLVAEGVLIEHRGCYGAAHPRPPTTVTAEQFFAE